MDEAKFTNILSKAQSLMLDENFNRLVEQKGNAFAGRRSNGADADIASMESTIFGGAAQTDTQTQPVQVLSEQTGSVKGVDALPEYMRESFIKTPPLTGDNSRLDSLTKDLQQNVQQVQQRQVLKETVIPTSNVIYYSLIKAIIDESVSRHMKTINESTAPAMKGMRFINGNTFQFIDAKGNLYEGVLKLKKKAAK